jgi:hypothetical protein
MSEIRSNSNTAGLNLNNVPMQIAEGQLSYALNAVVQGFDGNSITYQNELGNTLCTKIPVGYTVIGRKSLPNRGQIVLWLLKEESGDSEIGVVENCIYKTVINDRCLNFHIDHPIKKSVARGSQIYFTDNYNSRRYIDLDNPPFLEVYSDVECANIITGEVDCNKLNIQPNFSIPQIKATAIEGDAEITAGTYQFAVQYADSASNPYTQFFGILNPISIHDPFKITPDFNYPVNKSISLEISNLDRSGIFDFINVAVVRVINNIASYQLVGTYDVRNIVKIVYTGQSLGDLAADEIFETFPIYDKAKDVFALQDILGWAELKEKERIAYQQIFNGISLEWETHRLPGDGYTDPLNAANRRGYMRDEFYPVEAVLMFRDGGESDRIHIPGRPPMESDLEIVDNLDASTGDTACESPTTSKPRWQVYNTGEKTGSYIPTCEDIKYTGGTADTSNTINATISTTCSDGNCTHQGSITAKITLETALSVPITLEIGEIKRYPQNGNQKFGSGYEIYTLPAGVTSNLYFSIPKSPFVITIPAGVTEFTTTGDVNQKEYGLTQGHTWICHNCLFPIDTLYLKANNSDGKNIVFTSPQSYNVVNVAIYDDTVTEGEPPTAEVFTYPCMDDCYTGPYEFGTMAYHESTELYPCDESIWGELAGKPIRHQRFPDNLVTHHHDKDGYIYPIGIKFNIQQIINSLNNSTLTQEQKDRIVGVKILRGSRVNNKTVLAKGLISNVLKYTSNNRLISAKNVSGSAGDNDITTTSIEQAHELFRKGERTFGGGGEEGIIHLKLDQILADKDNYGTDEFNARIEDVIANMIEFRENTISSDNHKAFVDSAIQVMESLLDTSISYQETIADQAADDAANANTDDDDNIEITTDGESYFPNYLFNDVRPRDPFIRVRTETEAGLIYDESNKFRYVFHSPDTSFYQPTLGNILKIEAVEKGRSTSHIVETQRHAKYQMINTNAFLTALLAGVAIGFASGMYGTSDQPFDGAAAFTSYQALTDIIFKLTPRRNYAHQVNAVGRYTDFEPVPNSGNKIRQTDIATYLAPGKFSVGDDKPVNNFQRESSVYLRTTALLPYVQEQVVVPQDRSKTIFTDFDDHESTIASYYASIKRNNPEQWGQVFSYETIDTGYARLFNLADEGLEPETVFGGDIFINKFAYKTKFPFFTDNRINPDGANIYPDESDISYNELSNVGRVKYWFTTDITKGGGVLKTVFGIRAHKFFWPQNRFFNDYGLIFLYAYGIPVFFVESEVNVDLRQAYNSKEGDFYPRVSSTIPDEWLQEYLVTINQDNTYNYNKSYSKGNKEHFYSKLPLDFTSLQKNDLNERNKYRIVISDQEDNQPRNNWLIYRPISYFDLPRTFGPLTSIETLEDRAILVRFADKSMIYNALVTLNTSGPKAAYIGNDSLFKGAPPLDFAETDIGYNGSQHVFFLKTEFGHITVDAKRGRVFLISGNKAKDLTDEQSGVSSFFRQHLPFDMPNYFPNFDIDNNFKDVGLHGVFNGRRFILTKLDYKPLRNDITYRQGRFWIGTKHIQITDRTYFCPTGFTISFNFDTLRWVSFHSYLPNYYINDVKQFYSGIPGGLWKHENDISLYNNFYGNIQPYIIETPLAFKAQDEILQDVRVYSKIYKQLSETSQVATDDVFFNKAWIFNDSQHSGVLNLFPKPQRNLQQLRQFPKLLADGKNILFTKSDNIYAYNCFWDVVKDKTLPLFTENCSVLDKDINELNMDYSYQRKKELIRGKDVKIRHILDNRSDARIISQFLLTENQISFK